MSVQAASWARAIGKVHNQGRPLRQAVLNELADHANADGYCYPSMQRLAENTCMSYSSVRRELSALESMGIVTRRRRRGEDGKQGGYEYWLQMQQGALLAPPAGDPAFTQSGGHSEHSEGQPPLTVSATSVHCEHTPPLSVSGQNRQGEPSREPSGESPRAPAREAKSDQGEKRTITFAGTRLDVSAAPGSLSDETIQELLAWQRERDPRWRPTLFGVQQTMRELAKAAAKGWEPEQAIGIWQQAGWSTFQAHYLDRMADEGDSETSNANTDEAWARLVRHCRGGHSISDVEATDAALAEAARNLGGMTYLRRLTERDLEFQKRKFPPLYRAALQQQSPAAEA